ncbi:universal stress protein [Halegenticoccus tardaugens]|uniref:universal stress protein n=1 Tax=Halegenticoccus tardaugens TaxID=2071624 RepID=UPI00100B01DF
MYTEILLPTDGSPPADAALEHAFDLAKRYDARLHALFVVQNDVYTRFTADAGVIANALDEEARATLDGIEATASENGIDVVTTVAEGRPYEEILAYADEAGIDLVVMGTHGRSGLDRYLIGSVTERVVRAADAPVLTVRYHGEESGTEEGGAGESETEGNESTDVA